MIKFTVERNFEVIDEQLKRIESRQWPFVLREAVNSYGFRMLEKTKRDIPKFIDNPTPFTINSFRLERATKSNPVATLFWRDWPGKDIGAGRPMLNQAQGGTRKQKAFERALQAFQFLPRGWVAIPSEGGLQRDAYGNIKGQTYTQILSYLRADRSGTQARPSGKLNSRQRARQAKRVSKYFVVSYGKVVGSLRNISLQDGIYERIASAFGAATRQIFFFQNQASYRVTYPVEKISQEFFNKVIGEEVTKAVDKAINTTRPSS